MSEQQEHTEPTQTRDDTDQGWGEVLVDPTDEDDVARLEAERPPHHDR